MSSQGKEKAIPRFFKIVLPKSLQDGELRIPRSFVTKYWKGLSNSKAIVVLRVPDGGGDEWEVEWTERDGDVWLKNGWKNFADFYSIGDGHFLVFRYEGGNKFEVMVFGRDGINGRRCMRSSWNKVNVESSLKDNIIIGSSSRGTKSALERAKKFHSEKPFFVRPMYPTYVHSGYMVVPCDFSARYLEGMEGKASIMVSDDEEKKMTSWEVNFKYTLGNKRSVFTAGWGLFAEDNGLKEGDVCVFELIHHHAPPQQLSFQVVIFRST
ncbi:B3 domain-containing transcription factor VRN1-like [Senna tora]|uniref:B3 domain-containing transcription factor VRN1-like n=1 Tax=Senna tora TaxID=362788 RepID=A0A834T5Q1_9FABA|nr:B3 domain-containing transcription factor VRN1-like [Senna tora]